MNLDDEALMTSYRDTGCPELLAELRSRHIDRVTEVMTWNLPVQFEAAIEDVFRGLERTRRHFRGTFLVWLYAILQAVRQDRERTICLITDPTLSEQLDEAKRLVAALRPSDRQMNEIYLPKITPLDGSTMTEGAYARLQAALRILRNSDGIVCNNSNLLRSTNGEHQ